eukprot:GHVL01039262.1.p1 GENE.GHVL01039262.1~~GHVL01039262.1.p1  ORF type:complete len:138 (+),score=23.91 GHVL01039262.1:405-818(+)
MIKKSNVDPKELQQLMIKEMAFHQALDNFIKFLQGELTKYHEKKQEEKVLQERQEEKVLQERREALFNPKFTELANLLAELKARLHQQDAIYTPKVLNYLDVAIKGLKNARNFALPTPLPTVQKHNAVQQQDESKDN